MAAILLVYTDWCPACKEHRSFLESNAEAAREANDLIMIRVNQDHDPKLSSKFDFDGQYIPRTFALYPDGTVMHELFPPKGHRYFLTGPTSLLNLMRQAKSAVTEH